MANQPSNDPASNSESDPETGTGGDAAVTLTVNEDRCIGAGQCEMLAPNHFRVDDDSALAEFLGDGSLAPGDAEVVIDRCPSGALSIAADGADIED